MKKFELKPYFTKQSLMQDYALSRSSVDRILHFIREYTGKLYPREAVREFGNRVKISEACFLDAWETMELLKRGVIDEVD